MLIQRITVNNSSTTKNYYPEADLLADFLSDSG